MGANWDAFSYLKPKRRLSDEAVDQVLDLLRSGQLQAGDKLPPERDLVGRLGVSRNSLREGVRILETMGVLRVVPGRGTFVTDSPEPNGSSFAASWLPSHGRDVVDLLEMRETLEVKAASLASIRGTREEFRRIQAALAALHEAISGGQTEAIVAADTALHDAIAAASGNRILIDALRGLADLVKDTRRAVTAIPGRLRRMGAEHDSLVEAILCGDPEAAGRAMFYHVRRVEDEVQALAGPIKDR